MSLTVVCHHLFNGALMSDQDEAERPETTLIAEGTPDAARLGANGGRARWRGVDAATRARLMRRVVAARWRTRVTVTAPNRGAP